MRLARRHLVARRIPGLCALLGNGVIGRVECLIETPVELFVLFVTVVFAKAPLKGLVEKVGVLGHGFRDLFLPLRARPPIRSGKVTGQTIGAEQLLELVARVVTPGVGERRLVLHEAAGGEQGIEDAAPAIGAHAVHALKQVPHALLTPAGGRELA